MVDNVSDYVRQFTLNQSKLRIRVSVETITVALFAWFVYL